jgi:hypothetical protein
VNLIIAMVLTMTVTAYAPDAGGINGNGRFMADGTPPAMGYAACGPRYPFGTVFELMPADGKALPPEFPHVVECRDRGGFIGPGNLDIVVKTGDVKRDLKVAREWGRQRIKVRVWANWDVYIRHEVDQLHEADELAQARVVTPAE